MMEGIRRIENFDKEKSTIALRVYENHLRGLYERMNRSSNFFDLTEHPYFKNGIRGRKDVDLTKIKKLLINSWSTEMALINSLRSLDSDYKKFSLHWCFPQSYYSVFLSTSAYYSAKNILLGHNHKAVLKEFANQVKRNWYPPSISFLCSGSYKSYDYFNIRDYIPKNSLSFSANRDDSPDQQIAQFLKTTRDLLLEKRKKERQGGKNAILTAKGKPKTSFTQTDWVDTSKNQWGTTILDLLYRLRIKSNYEEIDGFINSDFDVTLIIEFLSKIVYRLNFINECFIAKIIGIKEYENIIKAFPPSVDSPALGRFHIHISENI